MHASTVDTQTVRLANGLQLQCRQSGDPRGAPVILLHGVTDSLKSWRPFTDALPRSIRAIAVSQRGHGDSSRPDHDYGSAAFAGDLAALMDALGIRRAHIVGHSMGTWVAQRFVRDYADRVESVTLIGGFVTLAGNADVAELMREINAADRIDPAFVRAFQESTVASPLPSTFLEMVVDESMKVPIHVWRAAFAAFASEAPGKAWIDHRALLISCGKDAFFKDKDRRELAAVFVSGREIFYDDLGHAPHWEEPARVAKDVAAFVLAQ